MPRALTYGGVPVPYTVSWTGEERHFIAPCKYADNRPAHCMAVAPGQGKPNFGKPHMNRQREVIGLDLCDLCGRSVSARTKVSLSHARLRHHGAEGPAILQVEPLLHRECAAISVRHCPSLKRDIAAGIVEIKQVTRYRVQFAIVDPEYVSLYVPDYHAQPHERIVGHAKIELLDWVERDRRWLGVTDA
jgi:hypothetical protein